MAKKKTAQTKRQLHDSSKSIWVILALVVVILGGAFATMPNTNKSVTKPSPVMQQPMAFDFGNQRFTIDDQELAFVNGTRKDVDGNGSAYIAHSSINKSGKNAAAILINNPGGSGTFAYIVGASLIDDKEVYSKPVLLGDRINIVSVNVEDADEYNNGTIIVTYLDRKPDESMASEAKQETTKEFAFEEDGNLIEVVN